MSPHEGLQVINIGNDGLIPTVQSAANLGYKVQMIGYREKENAEVGLEGFPSRLTSPVIMKP